MIEQVAALDDTFFKPTATQSLKKGVSLEARLLLPLKTSCYGVPTHCFCDYFEMSKQFARDCCKEFGRIVHTVYKGKYLKMPDANALSLECEKRPSRSSQAVCMVTPW